MFMLYATGIFIPLAMFALLMHLRKWKLRTDYGRSRAIMYGISTILFGLLVATLAYLGGTAKTRFNEVWNYKATEVRYYEDWNEKVSCSHAKYCTRTVSRTDSKGKSYTTTEQYQCGWLHPYDVDYHPEHWDAVTEYGRQERISQTSYNKWKGVFTGGEIIKKDMHRNYHTNDGDMYYSTWDNTFDKMYPLHSIHTYQNKVRVSDSIFQYAEVDEVIAKLYPRPADQGSTLPVISYGPTIAVHEQLVLRRVNATFGSSHQIHCMVVLFNGESIDIIEDVLNAWKGPNKNELVMFIGIDDNRKVLWSEVTSWMDDTTIHAYLRSSIVNMKEFDANVLADTLKEAIPKYWSRKEFSDFDYIKIPISMGWYLMNLLLGIASCIVATIVAERNYPIR